MMIIGNSRPTPSVDMIELGVTHDASPELRMIFGIIQQALDDAFLSKKVKLRVAQKKGEKRVKGVQRADIYEYVENPIRENARWWLLNKNTGFSLYCDLIGWDLEFVQKKIRQLISIRDGIEYFS